MSGFQPSGSSTAVTQAFGLGWDMAAPLALNGACVNDGARVDDVDEREMTIYRADDTPNTYCTIECHRRVFCGQNLEPIS